MGIKYGRKRTTEIRATNEGSKPEGASRSLGAIPDSSGTTGTHPVGIGREDSHESDNFVGGDRPDSQISGKALEHLVEETRKQLAYHEQQAQILRTRLDELQAIDIKHTE
jgi:hypothetical protein